MVILKKMHVYVNNGSKDPRNKYINMIIPLEDREVPEEMRMFYDDVSQKNKKERREECA